MAGAGDNQGQGKVIALVIPAIAVTFALFHLWFLSVGRLATLQLTYIHLAFALVLIFLAFPVVRLGPRASRARKIFRWAVDLSLAGAAIVVGGYVAINFLELASKGAGDPDRLSIILGVITTVLVIEGTRRVVGLALPILAILFILYAFYGRSFPGMLAHRGYDLDRVASVLYLTTDGISGLPLQVSATYVAAFVIFAAFLDVSGAGRFFINWSNALVGWVRGGPAKVAVMASALMGTISGSAVANVVSTGPFTIPLMKHVGLRPAFAGGVEAAASSGGQIMPPVMGAAAFIMVEILGVPYTDIVTAAILPATLYFIGILVMIDLEVTRLGIRGMDRSELGSASRIFLANGHLALPLVLLLFLLFYVDYTPTTSAFFATCAVIASCYLRRGTFLPPRQIIEGLRRGAMGLLEVATVCACAGIIIGVMMLTGLGLRLSAILIDISGGNLAILLVLTAIVALILGMGLPSSAVYVVLATLVAPAMVKLGVNPIAAHLFVFYFGVLGNVTPPVAIAAYAAAALAGANATSTGLVAFRLAMAGFLLPFVWIYSPSLILEGELIDVAGTALSAIVGIVALGGALQGNLWSLPLPVPSRLLLLGAAIALIVPGWETDAAGLALIAATVLVSRHVYGRRIAAQAHLMAARKEEA